MFPTDLSKTLRFALFCLLAQSLAPGSAAADTPTLTQRLEAVQREATQLKVATFRGSLDLMKQRYDALVANLPNNPADPEMGTLCNYFCHYQLANYHFFKATHYPYLMSISSSSSSDATKAISPDAVKAEADAGIAIIERGLSLLYRQQTVETGNKELAFREFTRQAALLNTLKVRLYLAAGDAWYQAVSKARLEYLDHLVTKAIDKGSSSQEPSEFAYASGYYEQASWSLVEIQTDIPADGPEFASIRDDLKVLSHDVESRLQSVRKGFLFLNIDPEAITSISVDELQAYLTSLYKKVKESESILDDLVTEYSDRLQKHQIAELDQARMINGRSMDLSLNKIATLEAEAGKLQADYKGKIDKLDSQIDMSQTRRAIREIEFELQQKQLEYNTQIKLIAERNEQDLLALNQASHEERRQELRWLIDHQLAILNLNLQLDAFEIQIEEYDRQLGNNRGELSQVESRFRQRAASIAGELAVIRQAEAEKSRLNQQRSQVFSARMAVYSVSQAGIDSRLSGIETLRSKQQAVCDWRSQVADKTIQKYDEVIGCIQGKGCAGELAQDATIKDLSKRKLDLITNQKFHINKIIAHIQAQKASIETAQATFSTAKAASDLVLAGLEAAAAAAHAVPKISVAVGLVAFTMTQADISGTADAALAAGRRVQEGVIDLARFNIEMENLKKEADHKLYEAQARLHELMDQHVVEQFAVKEALSELMGRKLENELAKGNVELDKDTVAKECELEFAQMDQEKMTLEAERKRLEEEAKWETAQNSLIDQELQKQEAVIAEAKAQIDRFVAEQDELNKEKSRINEDSKRIGDLKTIVDKSRGRVTKARSEVDSLAVESTQLTGIINDLQDERRRKSLAIKDTEVNGLTLALKQDRTAASERIKDLTAILDQQITLEGLKDQMNASQKTVADMIASERQKLVEQSEKLLKFEQDAATTSVKLVLASEENLSNIIAGIPNYIDTKKRALESANFAINMLRGRVRAIQAASVEPGIQADAPRSFYLHSGADFVNAVTDLCNGDIAACVNGRGLFFDEREVNIVGTVITVPRSSTLVRMLLEKGKANFRVVPRALSPQDMQANGYLEIGLPDMSSTKGFNASLLDIRLAARCVSSSTPQLGVRHLGIGSWFQPVKDLGYLALPELTAQDSRFTVVNVNDIIGGIDAFVRTVKYPVGDRTVRVRSFDRDLDAAELSADYLGLPLFGSYQLNMQASSCLDQAEQLYIGLIYTKTVDP